MKITKKIKASPVIESMFTYTFLILLSFFIIFSVINFRDSSLLETRVSEATRQAITSETWHLAFAEAEASLRTHYGEETVIIMAEIRDGENPNAILASTGSFGVSGVANQNSPEMEEHWRIGNRLIIYGYRTGSARTFLSDATAVRFPNRDEPIRLIRRHIIETSELIIENESR